MIFQMKGDLSNWDTHIKSMKHTHEEYTKYEEYTQSITELCLYSQSQIYINWIACEPRARKTQFFFSSFICLCNIGTLYKHRK